MNELATLTFWILLGLAGGQGLMVLGWLRVLVRRTVALESDDAYCPRAAVILCLRGSDPFLTDCVEALLDQDYPEYEIRFVVDRREDPAWQVVEEVLQQRKATNVRIDPLRERRGTCSLKIASMLQAISGLDSSHEVVVLLDSDTIAHRTWLRELVAPLADERVGAAAGNRWYMPADASCGSLVRYLWNVAAVVQMYWYGIAWGGSMALKTSVFDRSDLLDRLAHAFGEDSTICRALVRAKLRVAFVPSAMMVNRETCDVPGFFHFLQRQLLTVRLHNPWWWAVVGHGIVTSAAQLFALGLLLVALLKTEWEVAAWAGGGLALYLAAMVLLMVPMEIGVQRIVRARREPTDWLSGATALRVMLAIPLTQVIYAAGLVSTFFVRIHQWRGIVYQFDGARSVRVIEDRPYVDTHSDSQTATSL